MKNAKFELPKVQEKAADARGIHLYNPFLKEIVFLEEVDICLVVEGTYPYVKGGVSSVVHQVIQSLPQYKFGILHVAWNEESPQKGLYQELPQIKWVHPYLLGSHLANHPSKLMPEVFEKNGLTKQKKFFSTSKRWSGLATFSRRKKVGSLFLISTDYFRVQTNYVPRIFLGFTTSS